MLPLERQRQLQDQQLLVDESPPGLLEMLAARWGVNFGHGALDGPQVVRCQVVGRKDFVELARAGVEHRAHQAADVMLGQAFGQRVDGQQLPGRRPLVGFDLADPRMGHFPARGAALGAAGKQQGLAAAEFVAQKGLVEPDGPQVVVALPQEQAEDRAALPAVGQVDFLDGAQHADERPFFQFGDRRRSVRSW